MIEHECERCGVIFKMKKHLVQHLKKRVKCIGIESERTQEELLEELNKKEGLDCEKCKRVYKNEESLRKHICKELLENVKDELEKRIDELQKELRGVINNKEKVKQVANSITNNDNRKSV